MLYVNTLINILHNVVYLDIIHYKLLHAMKYPVFVVYQEITQYQLLFAN